MKPQTLYMVVGDHGVYVPVFDRHCKVYLDEDIAKQRAVEIGPEARVVKVKIMEVKDGEK